MGMTEITAQSFAGMLALVGVVIIIAALLSGFIERSNLPQVAVFLALGAALGPAGLQVMDVGLDSPVLRVVATLSLALVLFTDAVSLNVRQVKQHAGLALLVLGPGTMLTAGLVAAAGWYLLALPPAGAVILGAALASTDPVLLRGLLRSGPLPESARQALRLESGLNDVVLLPVVLVAMVFLVPAGESHVSWGRMAMELFLLGPAAGVLVGLLAVSTLDLVRKRIGIRRDYESLYSLGVAFAAFAAAESVHGSGFLAVFAAGLVISWLDVELCDCFLEYGETTAEMALLFAFVLLGGALIWTGMNHLHLAGIVFAVFVIVARPAAFLLSLARYRMDAPSRLLIAWFGPRGLSSLLLVLLPVFERIPVSQRLFELCSLVVLASILVHGGSIIALNRRPSSSEVSRPKPPTLPAETAGPPESAAGDSERITLEDLAGLEERGDTVILADSRTERTLEESGTTLPRAVRLHPDHAARDAAIEGIPKEAALAVFCA
jgi:NhaP-type Na+/H+ or K+/H+ antiporter